MNFREVAMNKADTSKKRSKVAKGLAIGVAGGAALVGAACAAVAPRKDPGIEVLWRDMSRYRYAHRGLHDAQSAVPENSLEAFRWARTAGFASELDVHLTVDGIPVVIHDSDLSRMTGRPGFVEKLTIHQLASYKLSGTCFGIPTLDEVLSLYDWGLDRMMPPPLMVELKVEGNAAALCKAVMKMLTMCAMSCKAFIRRYLRGCVYTGQRLFVVSSRQTF